MQQFPLPLLIDIVSNYWKDIGLREHLLVALRNIEKPPILFSAQQQQTNSSNSTSTNDQYENDIQLPPDLANANTISIVLSASQHSEDPGITLLLVALHVYRPFFAILAR